jgi:hypothetical protein
MKLQIDNRISFVKFNIDYMYKDIWYRYFNQLILRTR